MDLGWVGMTSTVWSEKVRTSRWTSRQTSRGSMSQVWALVKGGFSLSSRETMRGKPNILLRNSKLKTQKTKATCKSFELDMNASQAC